MVHQYFGEELKIGFFKYVYYNINIMCMLIEFQAKE